MTTAIDSIYTAIAAFSTTYDTDNPVNTWNYTALDGSKQPACPQRYISCSGSLDGAHAFIALGSPTCVITWTIQDTLLMKPATLGNSLVDNSSKITDYIEKYVTAIRSGRATTAQSHITAAKFEPGIYYWPEDASAGTAYIGVRVTLTIEEVISG